MICLRQYIFHIGGYLGNNVPQSSLYFMDLTSKLSWVLQTGKVNPPGILGQVMSNYILEESFSKILELLLLINVTFSLCSGGLSIRERYTAYDFKSIYMYVKKQHVLTN